MSFRTFPFISLAWLALVLNPSNAFANGWSIQYRTTQGVSSLAAFDSGKPMVEAQVLVFAFGNPAIPWMQGKTDLNGRFDFVPDPDLQGTWDVQLRQTGHGTTASIPLEASASSLRAGDVTALSSTVLASASLQVGSSLSSAQIVLMSAADLWECIGTACFFAWKES